MPKGEVKLGTVKGLGEIASIIEKFGPQSGTIIIAMGYLIYFYIDRWRTKKSELELVHEQLREQTKEIHKMTRSVGDIGKIVNLLINSNINYRAGNEENGDRIAETACNKAREVEEEYGKEPNGGDLDC